MSSSVKEVKSKKDKSSKKSKSDKKTEPVTEVTITETEDVTMTESTDVVVKKSKKEKKEKKEKKSKTGDVEATSEIVEVTITETIAEPKAKKSKRTREAEDGEAKENSPAPDAMEVDNDEEPSAKKQKVGKLGEGLEVDVTLPQPPSKKELRRLKKGKSLPKKKTEGELKAPLKEGEEEKPEKKEQEKRSEHGIWVGNLPWSVSKEDLKSFLINQGPMDEASITRIHMPSPEDGKPANQVESRFTRRQHNKGFAYVDFATAEDTNKAVALSEELLGGRRVLIKNNKSFEGRPLVLKEDKNKKPEGKPPNKRIFLGNLRFDTTEESLKEHFEQCGPIEQCMVATFEDSGKCKGYAWITFADLEGSARAVRGFVLQEDVGSDEESDDEEEKEVEEPESDPEDYAQAATKEKKPAKKWPMKRVYVNMIQRRPIRIEYAEDAGIRYKKRYGAGGTKNPLGLDAGNPNERHPEKNPNRAPVSTTPRVEKEVVPVSGVIAPSKKAQKMDYRNEYAPRLTGGIVESKGTKVTF